MRDPLERRIARLEALQPPKSDKIPIFGWKEDDVPKKIEEMIAAGKIAEADRHRCAFWLDIKHHMEWRRQWEDEKLLAADAARQKARQEQAEREKAERENPERKTAGPDETEQQRTGQDTAEPQNREQQQPEPPQSAPESAEPPQAEPPQPEQAPEQPTTDDDGTVPPGCRN